VVSVVGTALANMLNVRYYTVTNQIYARFHNFRVDHSYDSSANEGSHARLPKRFDYSVLGNVEIFFRTSRVELCPIR